MSGFVERNITTEKNRTNRIVELKLVTHKLTMLKVAVQHKKKSTPNESCRT